MGYERTIKEGDLLLGEAKRCWEGMATFRRDRDRAKRFTYGDQWGDLVPTDAGIMTEADYIYSQGNIPLKNNLIRRLVRNVLGVFRNQWQPPACHARDPAERRHAEAVGRLIEYNIETNRLEEVYARTMEEFLISGMAVHRKWYGRKGNRTECWTDFVSPDNFFADINSRDFRGWDLSIVGELHDMTYAALCASFAADDEEADELRQIYGIGPGSGHGPASQFGAASRGADFLRPAEAGMCRVIEIWHKEYIAVYHCHDTLNGEYYNVTPGQYEAMVGAENRRRSRAGIPLIQSSRGIEEEWHYHFISPTGHTLRSGITPYAHRRHPYIFKAYPFIDGEIHSFVSDIIDQQKFTNRLISMYDWVLRASAKGVLLFPEGALPPGMSIEDVADEWSRFNGVLVYRPRPGDPLPQQVSSGASNPGITELLNIQLKMMEDISGVNGALQGKLDSGSISGTLYNQQTRNSLTALADLLKSFNDFIIECTETDASNIRQFYTRRRIESILGPDAADLRPQRNFTDSGIDFRFE